MREFKEKRLTAKWQQSVLKIKMRRKKVPIARGEKDELEKEIKLTD
jgi:hypothetical protein